MNIILSTPALTVKKILKKTKAKLFEDLEVGDIITITKELQETTSRRGCHASNFTVYHQRLRKSTFTTETILKKNLEKFEFFVRN